MMGSQFHPFFNFMNPEHLEEMAKNMEEVANKMSERSQDAAANSEKKGEEGEDTTQQQPPFQPFLGFMSDLAKTVAEITPENVEEEIAARLFPHKNKTRWIESEDNYTFEMDVPGVRPHQVVIEEKAGDIEVSAIRMKNESDIEKSYQESLYISPHKADLARAFATLIDGVLSLTVPKKNNEPVDLVPEGGAPPPETPQEFRATLDLPGVKGSALQAQGREGKVYVEATRQLGRRTTTLKRVIEVQPPSAPMAQARVFLQDGVFTLLVPTQSEDMGELKPAGMRTIYVTQDEVPEALATLSLEDESPKKEEGLKEAMVVETVLDEEDKAAWEQVNEDGKKLA